MPTAGQHRGSWGPVELEAGGGQGEHLATSQTETGTYGSHSLRMGICLVRREHREAAHL